MQRLPIARSFRLALVGLTVVLAVIAGFGVASLYNSRQRYEDTLSSTAALTTAAANLYTAGLVQQEVVRNALGTSAAGQRAHAQTAYTTAVATARVRAAGDPVSLRIINQAAGAQAAGRYGQARAEAAALQTRQQARARSARDTATSESRRALIILGVAGVLALLAALGLGSALIAAMRRPLEELVGATSELAAGTLARRVQPAGPRELRELGSAFNAMAGELEAARSRLESERQRLAVVIESLQDALIVSELGSSTISAVNPTVAVLVPELTVGSRTDGEQSPLPALDAALSGETFVEHRGRTLAVTAARLGTGDSDGGVVWTVRDTTERAKLERAKSEFVATASHELRSPLTSIKGFVELLNRSPENMSSASESSLRSSSSRPTG